MVMVCGGGDGGGEEVVVVCGGDRGVHSSGYLPSKQHTNPLHWCWCRWLQKHVQL